MLNSKSWSGVATDSELLERLCKPTRKGSDMAVCAKSSSAVLVALVCCGCGTRLPPANESHESVAMRPTETTRPPASGASGVESLLLAGRWTKRDGLSRGVVWQFDAGGRVLVTDGGNVDESYRWEVLARNEGARSITIKYRSTIDPPNDFREWKLTFAPDGKSAMLENWRNKNGRRDLRGESPVYLVP